LGHKNRFIVHESRVWFHLLEFYREINTIPKSNIFFNRNGEAMAFRGVNFQRLPKFLVFIMIREELLIFSFKSWPRSIANPADP